MYNQLLYLKKLKALAYSSTDKNVILGDLTALQTRYCQFFAPAMKIVPNKAKAE